MENKELREIPDLLYPDAAGRRELNNRRIMLNDKYPCTYMNDLMTDNVAGIISRRNPQNVLKLFRELCTDTEVMNYRLDALEDVMGNPKLSPSVHRIIRTLLDSEHKNISASTPDSFSALGSCVEALDSYIDCMEELHALYGEIGSNIHSAAFRGLFDSLEERYASNDYNSMKKDIAELKEAFSKKIRSVNIAINFNEEMKPISAGITGWSDKPAGEKPNVFDRLFYKSNAFSETHIMGKLRTNQPNEDGYVNEADKALFAAMER